MRIPNSVFLTPVVIGLFAITLSLMNPSQASAGAVCGDRTSLLKQLAGNYKEAPASMGLAANGSVVEVTKSETGTWTILLTHPNGVTCVIAAGEHWENLKQKAVGYQPS